MAVHERTQEARSVEVDVGFMAKLKSTETIGDIIIALYVSLVLLAIESFNLFLKEQTGISDLTNKVISILFVFVILVILIYHFRIIDDVKLGKYKHYKGKFYKVIGTARHSETEEEMVVYQALYGKKLLWVRPKKMFLENVLVEGKKVPRFNFVGKK